MPGQIVHFEIPADDTAKSREFWGSLFGWQFQEFPGTSEYHMTEITPGQTGGAITNMQPGKRGTRAYFGVDEINAGAARVKELGGAEHLGVRAAQHADDAGRAQVRGRFGQRVAGHPPGRDAAPGQDGRSRGPGGGRHRTGVDVVAAARSTPLAPGRRGRSARARTRCRVGRGRSRTSPCPEPGPARSPRPPVP